MKSCSTFLGGLGFTVATLAVVRILSADPTPTVYPTIAPAGGHATVAAVPVQAPYVVRLPVIASAPQPTGAPVVEAYDPYADHASDLADAYATAFDSLEELFGQAGTNPELILDGEWRVQALATIALIREINDIMHTLIPPAAFAATHAHLLLAADHYDSAMTLYAQALDTLDANQVLAATEAMQAGRAEINRATALLP